MNRGALREPSKASRASETARMCRAFSRILSVPAELFEQWKLERRCPAASGRWEARRGEATWEAGTSQPAWNASIPDGSWWRQKGMQVDCVRVGS